MKILKINQQVYLVNKNWKKASKVGARVIPAKIAGYQNIDGKVNYVLKVKSLEYDPTTNHIFTELTDAVAAIK